MELYRNYDQQSPHSLFFVFFPQIYDAEGTLQHFIDGNDPTKSSWMRYIRCARHCGEQNMMVVQYRWERVSSFHY